VKEIATNIDFADASYKSCETSNGDLIIYLNSWDEKTLKITFIHAIRFIYRGGSFIAGALLRNRPHVKFSVAYK
jgi:hypothetical protein